jgi:hypothetical protein
MGDRLVTVATFDGPTQAQLARGVLADAGIRAVLTDEETVSLFWHLSNAVGGIKVQVMEADADRAVAALEAALGPDGDADPAVTAAAETEDEPPAPPPTAAAVAAVEDAPAPPPGSREDYARRLFFAAWFGLALPPIWFFALYLFLNAAFGEGELTPRGRYNLLVGGFVTALGLPMAFIFVYFFGSLL